MHSLFYSLFLISVLAPACVSAANDWSVPCVSGSCSWDTGDGNTTAYSSMTLGGTNNLISDITPAAGWNIQGCDPNWANGSHTVQMTCSGPSNSTQYCGHVYEGGAENTIVRLPENCGKGPFARIVSATNKTDSIARRIANPKANATISGTQTLILDYNFGQIPTSRGKATFAVTSSNLKGQSGVSKRELDALRGRGRAGELHRRRFASLSRRFDQTLNSGQLQPVNFNQDVTLFDQSISCSSGDVSGNAELKIDVDGQVDVTVSFGVTVVGTIVPPQITDFSVNANLGGSTSATFNVDATADGTFDTGAVPLFKTGLPGLSIPSIITLGPEFSINGQVTIDLKAEAKLAIEAAWDFPSVNLVFPQAKGASTGSATVSGTNNPLQLSADPSVDVSGTVTAHIIPRIDFGIDLFSGSEQASVFIDADISASLEMEVTASATVNNTDTTSSTDSATSTTATSTTDSAAAANTTLADANVNSTVTTTSSTDSAISTIAPSTTDSAAVAGNTTLADSNVNTTDTSGVTSTTDVSSLSTDTTSATSTTTDPLSTSVDPLSTSTNNSLSTSTDSSLSTSTDSSLSTSTDDSLTSTDSSLSTSTDGSLSTSTDNSLSTSASDPLATPTDDPLSTSTSDPLATPTPDPLSTATDDQLTTPTSDPLTTPTPDPLSTSTDDPLATPTDDPLATPTDDPLATPTDSSLDTSTADPLAAPTDDPLATPTDSSLDASTTTDDPLATPTDSSLDTSTDDPLATPTDDPLASPTDDPSVPTDDSGDPSTDDSGDPSTDDSVDPSTDDSGDPSTDDSGDPSTDDSGDPSTDDSGDPSTDDSGDPSTDDSGDPSTDDSDTSDFRRRSWPVLGGRDTSDSLNGCITLSGAIAINGGLQGSLEPFLNDQQTFPIFSNNVQLFQKCLNGPIGDSSAQRRSSIVRRAGDTSGLACPTKGVVSALQSII